VSSALDYRRESGIRRGMESDRKRVRLEELLEGASTSDMQGVRDFYLELLESKLLYLEDNSAKSLFGLLTMPVGEEIVVPVFSSVEKAQHWYGGHEGLPLKEMPFRELGFLIGPEMKLHLNPGSEVGKDLTYWEVTKLMSGELEELVFDLCDTGEDTLLEIRELPAELNSLLKRLAATFSAYIGLHEVRASLVGDSHGELLLLGYSASDFAAASLDSLRSELEMLFTSGVRLINLDQSEVVDPMHRLAKNGELIFKS